MNQAVSPANASFDVTFDGIPEPVTGTGWADARNLILSTNKLYDAGAVCLLNFPASDPTLQTIRGSVHEPFGPIDVPDPPWLNGPVGEWHIGHGPPPPHGTPEWDAWFAELKAFVHQTIDQHGPE